MGAVELGAWWRCRQMPQSRATRCRRPKFPNFRGIRFVFSAICGLSDIESVTQRILFLDSLFLLSFYQFFQLSTHLLCVHLDHLDDDDVRDLILYTLSCLFFCLLLVFLTLILSFTFD